MAERDQRGDLVQKATLGQRAALESLLLAHASRLARHIAHKLSESRPRIVDVDDVLQETLTQAIRDVHTCKAETEAGFAAWLNSVADHRLHDMLRGLRRKKRGGRTQQPAGQEATSGWLELLDLIADAKQTPSQSAARREAAAAIQIAVAGLPDDQRNAIRLRYLDGKSVHEAAEEMQRSPGAVKGLIHRARQALRDSLRRSSIWLDKR
jgi:RNA polymerase sigma-70 factor (ECF subfamily)